jgi:hypothetical protein
MANSNNETVDQCFQEESVAPSNTGARGFARRFALCNFKTVDQCFDEESVALCNTGARGFAVDNFNGRDPQTTSDGKKVTGTIISLRDSNGISRPMLKSNPVSSHSVDNPVIGMQKQSQALAQGSVHGRVKRSSTTPGGVPTHWRPSAINHIVVQQQLSADGNSICGTPRVHGRNTATSTDKEGSAHQGITARSCAQCLTEAGVVSPPSHQTVGHFRLRQLSAQYTVRVHQVIFSSQRLCMEWTVARPLGGVSVF